MSQQNAPSNDGASDLWIGAGVVLCLALGASMTYWLTNTQPAGHSKKKAVVQGELLNAKVTPGSKSAAAKTPVPVDDGGDFLMVTFDTLGSFYYEIPNLGDIKPEDGKLPKPKEQIPAPVKALGGKQVRVQGFMVPMKIEKGGTKSFLLVKDQSLCCYGRMPRMNEWISVKMAEGKTAKFIGDQPVTVFGKLDVGEEIEKGEVLSIFRMEAEDVAGPLDL